jgi:predicted nuclease of restriction endonuclease-like RecB superfamily
MFPKALLIAKTRGETVRPLLLSPEDPEAVTLVESILAAYRGSVGRPRREVLARIRTLEDRAQRFKVVRALALLVERRSEFARRPGPNPRALRERIFAAAPGGAVTPEERQAVLGSVAATLGTTPEEVEAQMWADLEEEERLVATEPSHPEAIIRAFNLGQLQTLLFRARTLTLSFGEETGYREACARVKRAGLMFTAQEGTPPALLLEGAVSFLRSTERYGTRLAGILPDLVGLPGWKLEAKIAVADSIGKERVRTLTLDAGVGPYLGVPAEPPKASGLPESLQVLLPGLRALGCTWEAHPSPVVAAAGLEFPDLKIEGPAGSAYLEAIGYWSPAWVEKKLRRTSSVHPPYLILANRDLAVGTLADDPRLLRAGKGGLEGRELKDKLIPRLTHGRAEGLVREPTTAGSEPWGDVVNLARTPVPGTRMRKAGYVILGHFAVRETVVGEIQRAVRSALPDLEAVECTLRKWRLEPSVLPHLGFLIRWKGLEATVVEA